MQAQHLKEPCWTPSSIPNPRMGKCVLSFPDFFQITLPIEKSRFPVYFLKLPFWLLLHSGTVCISLNTCPNCIMNHCFHLIRQFRAQIEATTNFNVPGTNSFTSYISWLLANTFSDLFIFVFASKISFYFVRITLYITMSGKQVKRRLALSRKKHRMPCSMLWEAASG